MNDYEQTTEAMDKLSESLQAAASRQTQEVAALLRVCRLLDERGCEVISIQSSGWYTGGDGQTFVHVSLHDFLCLLGEGGSATTETSDNLYGRVRRYKGTFHGVTLIACEFLEEIKLGGSQ